MSYRYFGWCDKCNHKNYGMPNSFGACYSCGWIVVYITKEVK